jgi:His-Xaa-Ser system protein HxsD
VAAIRAAAYRFGDRFAVAVEPSADTVTVRCLFAGHPNVSDIDRAMVEFLRELNDQVLRERVREETKHVRAVILAHTFSRATSAKDA